MPPLGVTRRNMLLAAAIAVAAIGALGTGTALWALAPRDAGARLREVIVPEGTGAAATARLLQEEGIIRHWAGFSVYATVTGRARSLQAGKYLLCPCDSVPEIVGAIASGRAQTTDRLVTLPEGMNIWEVDRALTSAGAIEPGALRRTYADREGRLFPDTYRFAEDAAVGDIVGILEHEFGTRVAADAEQLVVASILEEEAKTPEDMALVAGIIAKRLELGMPLQTDATVAYGWCVRTAGFSRDCDVTQAPLATELKADGPYNTYTRTGLPAGPISNPGLTALEAAAHPQASGYLYYLSTRDGSELIYATTLDEHLENRAKYLGF